ncbi:hypothetical protein [Streptomyces sp. NPDC002851]
MTRRRRPGRAARLLLAAALLGAGALTVTGCGNAGGPKSAGPTPSAIGPVRLWPEHPAATPQYGSTPVTVEVVKGIKVPDGGLHSVDPLKVVKAEVAAHPRTYTGADGLPRDTADAIAACPDKEPGELVKGCPVLQAYYRDLTGNGKDELIVGIDFSDSNLGIRVYSADGAKLVRIMATSEPVTSVELAGRDIITHSPATRPGYESRNVWSWDDRQRTMRPARMEVVRTQPGDDAPSPSAATP